MFTTRMRERAMVLNPGPIFFKIFIQKKLFSLVSDRTVHLFFYPFPGIFKKTVSMFS